MFIREQIDFFAATLLRTKTSMSIDPVCGKKVEFATADHSEHDGSCHHARGVGCTQMFLTVMQQ
ncbi:MAG: hypothetical protein KF726_18435 [Anaerolineae bacterium]|nr:hypothetical protein [Anaerolineae bacterium]